MFVFMYTSGPVCGYVIGICISTLKAHSLKGSVDGYINPVIETLFSIADEDDAPSSSKEELSTVNFIGLIL